jgi:hypothetical protein
MTDEQNPGVSGNPEPETSNKEPQVDANQQKPTAPTADEQERNWKKARTTMDEQREKIRMLEEKVAQMAVPPTKEEQADELESLADDDIVTKRQVVAREKKLLNKFKQEAYQEFHNKTAEERLEAKHPDFKAVCSPENIEQLKNRYPDLARSIASNTDVFSQGKAVYDMIVSLGIHNPEERQNREKMQSNMQKPQMTQGSKAGPLDTAHLFESGQRPSLTKSLKDTLWKEMQSCAKNY